MKALIGQLMLIVLGAVWVFVGARMLGWKTVGKIGLLVGVIFAWVIVAVMLIARK